MKDVDFINDALEEYSEWAVENKKIFSKIRKIVKEIRRTPFEGLGKPEPLKHGWTGWWSREITEGHRIVYKVEGNMIKIAACKNHYD
jgi:toxin YoeB